MTDPAGGRVEAFAYDAVGNRLSRTLDGVETLYQYDSNDRLLTETTDGTATEYQYDANGNTTRRATPSETTDYVWDWENRLVGASDTNGLDAAFAYDPEGIRQNRVVNGETTIFLVDPNRDYHQVLEETGGTGQTGRTFTFGDSLLGLTDSGGGRLNVHPDALGSVRALSSKRFLRFGVRQLRLLRVRGPRLSKRRREQPDSFRG